jgi:hypothetical protein
MNYAGVKPRRLLMIANDTFLTEEARRRQLDVVSMTSEEADRGALRGLSAGMFDAAVLYCTLERISDPVATLTQLRLHLTHGGVVMVIAATIDSRTARLFRAAWWEFNSRNLHYFSADTLQSLLPTTRNRRFQR